MNLPTQLFLDGSWRDSAAGRRTTLTNPATEKSFVEVAAGDVADVNAAVESAQRAWESGWRDLAPGKREAALHAVAGKLREHIDEIAQLEMLQIGKPISDARDEASLGARVFEYYAGAVTRCCGQTIPVGRVGKPRPRSPRATASCSNPRRSRRSPRSSSANSPTPRDCRPACSRCCPAAARPSATRS